MSDNDTHDLRASSRRSLWLALGLIGSFMIVEAVAGVLANSLALLADAAHMVTDAAAIGLSLAAIWLASRPESFTRTFGFHRTEILAALLNALALWLIAAWVFFEASRRFTQPPEVEGGLMLGVGLVGLAVNIGAALILRRSAGQSLNVEGAFLHVIGDLLGSVGVVLAGAMVVAFGWHVADAIFGIIIGVLIIASSGRLLWKVIHVLMEGTPTRINLHRLCQRFEQVGGVTGVHDIHAWTITTGYDVLSAHVTADEPSRRRPDRMLQSLRDIASREFGIAHVTIQLEESPEGCEEVHHIAHGDADESAPQDGSRQRGP